MNIAVLGSTGNVGAALSRELKQKGIFHFAATRKNFDYLKPSTYRPFLKGVRKLFLLVPLTPNLVEITGEILQAARKEGVERVVKLSAWGASPSSTARVLRWHAESDLLVKDLGVSYCLLRPNSFQQNFIHFHGPAIRRASVLAAPAGEAQVSFVDARDVARIAARQLLAPPTTLSLTGQCLEITGPLALSFSDAARTLTRVLGREIPYVAISEAQARERWEKVGLPLWRQDVLAELYETYRRNEAARITTTLGDEMGNAGTSLETFFEEHQEAFR